MTDEKRFRMLVIPDDGRQGYVAYVEDSLESFEQIIGADCLDMVTRSIGGRRYTILVDDCGLLKTRPITAFHSVGFPEPVLVGTIIITKVNRTGDEFEDLTDEDLAHISENTVQINHCSVIYDLDYARLIL